MCLVPTFMSHRHVFCMYIEEQSTREYALTQVGPTAGFFTEVLLKYLAMLNLELNELARLVTKEVVDRLGVKQMPVCVHMDSVTHSHQCSPQLFAIHSYASSFPKVHMALQHREGVLWDLWCLFTKQKYTLRPRSVSPVHSQRGDPHLCHS